jgi:hypothetical protein
LVIIAAVAGLGVLAHAAVDLGMAIEKLATGVMRPEMMAIAAAAAVVDRVGLDKRTKQPQSKQRNCDKRRNRRWIVVQSLLRN